MAYMKNGKTSSDEYEIRFEGRSGKQYRNIDHSMVDRIKRIMKRRYFSECLLFYAVQSISPSRFVVVQFIARPARACKPPNHRD